MCGFAGFVNLQGAPAEARVIEAMTRSVAHRGPDDSGQLLWSLRQGTLSGCAPHLPDSGIGVHRLKILDLTDAGRQPMVSPSAAVIVALNGEVYNAFDYRAELEAAGRRLRSRTDTEIVLHLYERYGIDGVLERLNGMFALAIADLHRHELHLARDHFGIKPLYWTRAGATLLFASEAKAFLAHPAFVAAIDEQHVDEQLAFRYVAGDASLLKGVHQVRPGCRVTVTPHGASVTRYSSIADPSDRATLTPDEAVEQLGALLRRSVSSQLASDVAVGCQLSGGIDSSLVTVLASQQAGTRVEAYSVVFDEPQFNEEPWIAEASEIAGVVAHRARLSADTFIAPLEHATWHMDQPISHPNAVGLWQLAAQARPRARVLLTGEGADEVFAGYARFADARFPTAETFVRATQFQPDAKLARLRPEADLTAAVARRIAIFNEGTGDHLSNCIRYEMQTFLVDVLMRQDKMNMAHGIENRVPFLDRRVVAFARTLPAALLVGGRAKAIVKALAGRTFSEAFVNRRKFAFNLPLSQYFRSQPFTELMEDQLLPGMKRRGMVSEPAARELWRRSLSAPALTEVAWIPVAFELWAQQFVDGRRSQASA
ncbi:MAG TPA: asparagine synthase (glutamine-hydrolyzing) [Vicinamibacterales bacterium]|nr:asparagine synthase (glutamine-hydrolyzing) [Vicinamibacterales bacterium]